MPWWRLPPLLVVHGVTVWGCVVAGARLPFVAGELLLWPKAYQAVTPPLLVKVPEMVWFDMLL
ncbi:hypothetical protein Dimus_024997 [Dionaea muscipula]